MMHRTTRTAIATIALGLAAAACGSDDTSSSAAPATTSSGTPAPTASDTTTDSEPAETNPDDDAASQMFPDVIDATAELDGETWTVSATLSSPYDSPERYADAWRVVGPDGTVFGERILTHDHAAEQPFTRSENGIEIPDDVDEVTIEGRDLENGYGGESFALSLPR